MIEPDFSQRPWRHRSDDWKFHEADWAGQHVVLVTEPDGIITAYPEHGPYLASYWAALAEARARKETIT